MDLFDIVAARAGGGSGGGTSQVQSDWNESNSSKKSFIKNKPFYKVEDRIYAEKDMECKVAGEEHHSTGFLYEYQNFTDSYAFNLKEGQSYTMEIIDEERLAAPIIFENVKIQDIQGMTGADHPIMGIIAGDLHSRDNVFIYLIDHNFNNGYIQYIEGGSTYSFGLIDKNNEYLTDGTVTVSFYQDFNGVTATEEYLPYLQPNWSENNSNSVSYVQNRTHWDEEVSKNELVLEWYPLNDYNPKPKHFGKRIGLVSGKDYTCTVVKNDDTTEEIQAIAEVSNTASSVVSINNTNFFLADGVKSVDGNVIEADDALYTINSNSVAKVIIHDLSHTELISHKISDKYIDQAVDYYFTAEKLSETIENTSVKYLTTALSYPDDTSMTFDARLICGEIDSGSTIGYFGLPVEMCDEATVANDRFANWECFSGLAVYNEAAFGNRFLTLDKIGELLSALGYCTSQETLVVPNSRKLNSRLHFELHYVVKITFPSKDIRDTVVTTMFEPVFSTATHYRLTYKKPNPQAKIGG